MDLLLILIKLEVLIQFKQKLCFAILESKFEIYTRPLDTNHENV